MCGEKKGRRLKFENKGEYRSGSNWKLKGLKGECIVFLELLTAIDIQ